MAGRYEDHPAQGDEEPALRPIIRASAFEGLSSGRSGLGNRAAGLPAKDASAFGWADSVDLGAEHDLPGLQPDEHLPWLHSAEDDLDRAGIDTARFWAVVLTGFALLLLIVGGVWWNAHRRADGAQLADGSLIAAPPGPIKEAPQDPGGKTFDGTGDSSFAVSQGQVPGATLAAGSDPADDGGATGTIPAAVEAADAALAGAGHPAGEIGVQIGAYSTPLAAEAAWAHLAKTYDALSGASHRIVAGTADIGTVYGLQAMAGSDAGANALCDKLKAAGLACRVKD